MEPGRPSPRGDRCVGLDALIARSGDFIVGGPNQRTDYHVNPTEEFFFQLKGDMTLRIQHEGKPYDVKITEGSIYTLPGRCVPKVPLA